MSFWRASNLLVRPPVPDYIIIEPQPEGGIALVWPAPEGGFAATGIKPDGHWALQGDRRHIEYRLPQKQSYFQAATAKIAYWCRKALTFWR